MEPVDISDTLDHSLLAKCYKISDDAARARARSSMEFFVNGNDTSHVFLGACDAHQLANENGDGGYFTNGLFKAFSEPDADTKTYTEVIRSLGIEKRYRVPNELIVGCSETHRHVQRFSVLY
jgi:hypothetical protein